MKILTFDLEIAKPVPELANGKLDWGAALAGECGCSVLCVHDSDDSRYHFYDKHTLRDGIDHLNTGDLLVSYNGKAFDSRVLESLSRVTVVDKHYDILDHIWRSLGKREKGYRLGDVAERTIGKTKADGGEHAPILWRKKRYADLYTYVTADVALTRDLFNHIIDVGWVRDTSGHELSLEVPCEEYA